MKLLLCVGNSELILNAKDVETILAIVDGKEQVIRTYKGSNKGFFGPDLAYEVKFKPFDATNNLGNVQVITDASLDKIRTLVAMREGEIVS
jgi:hypothetical protein